MMLLGKKIGMTQVYDTAGRICSVTVIQAGPCKIMQVKTSQTDGYNAVQLGFDQVKKSRVRKPEQGHAAKAKSEPMRFIREWRLPVDAEVKYLAGDQLTVSDFENVTFVDVVGTSKGKGFAGVMKRHHFGGFPASHGTERKHRAPGSQASHGTDRGHGGNIKKGKKMGGHMGNVRATGKNHRLVSIHKDENLLVVKGSVPGPNGGYVIVRRAKTKQ